MEEHKGVQNQEMQNNHLFSTQSTPAETPSNSSPSDAPPVEKSSNTKEYTTVIIGRILQGGVIVSATVILIGILLLPLHPGELSERSLQVFPHTLSQVWTGLLTLQPQAVIALGLLLLIASPVMRVAVSVVAFAIEHNRRYMVITLIVLAILITSFLIGKGGG